MKRLILLVLLLTAISCTESVKYPEKVSQEPVIFPDYTGVTVPSTIAPLNFGMKDEKFEKIDVVLTDAKGGTLHVQGRGTASFPMKAWKQMLASSVGDSINVLVSAKYAGSWKEFAPFAIYVSGDEIESHIAYRLISPSYGTVGQIGLFQRDITTFEQESVLESREFNACLNCHAFNRCDAGSMTLHVRGPQGGTFIMTPEDGTRIFNTKTDSTISNCAYPYWHPSGRYIAYSTNRTAQGYHQRPDKMLEVYDSASDINVYDIETNKLVSHRG